MKRTCDDYVITPQKKHNESKQLRIVSAAVSNDNDEHTGYLVWLGSRRGRTRGFVTWAETSVVDLSPCETKAWRYGTVSAARIAVARGLGAAADDYRIIIYTRRA
jgi:hypothetical protein